ncbi:MAG: Uma2 family endonuclease [Anaerolineae bacterium]|nr:Uma2 family endonuclease [Anaerolineae bacterium]
MLTETELWALGSDARVEVINGKITEMTPIGGLHHFVAGNIFSDLDVYVRANKRGYVFTHGFMYVLDRRDDRITSALIPDVSYVSMANLPANGDIHGLYTGAPTLAIEIMSPGDDVTTVLTKVRLYLKAGTEQVWVVYPVQQEIHQYKASTPDTVRVYQDSDVIDVESLFPGLKLVTSDLFIVPDLG